MVETRDQIKENQNSIAIKLLDQQYESLKTDFKSTIVPTGSDSIFAQFVQYNRFTDVNSNESLQKGCSSNAKDYWTTNLETCKDGYVKIDAGAKADGEPSCLLFKEWSSGQVAARYSERPSGCEGNIPEFQTVNGGITSYNTALRSFSNENDALLNQLISANKDLNDGFLSMSGKILTMISNMDGVIQPLVDIFNKLVGNAGIFALINCSKFLKFFYFLNILLLNFYLEFMGNDMRELLGILQNDFSPNATNTYICVVTAALLLYIGIMCMFIVILRKKIDPDAEANREQKFDVEMGKQA